MPDPSGAQLYALESLRNIPSSARLLGPGHAAPHPGPCAPLPRLGSGPRPSSSPVGPGRPGAAAAAAGAPVPAQCPLPLHPPTPPRSSHSGAQPDVARPAGSLLSPPGASRPDLPKSPPVGARPAAPRPAPLTPGRVFCSCSALWAFSADSRSQ